MENKTVRIQRKNALGMEELVKMYIDSMKLSAGLNTQRIFAAWDEVSSAGKYTLKTYFRDGKLYVTLNSSLVRNKMNTMKEELIRNINEKLENDPLFTKGDARVGYVNELIFK